MRSSPPSRKKAERFRGAHALGWCLGIFAMLLFLGAAVLAGWDGIKNDFPFGTFFARYLVILYVMEIYDILFFDRALLCHSNFFSRFYHEVKGIVSPQLFGYNKKAHLTHFLLYLPLSAALAWVCTLF